MKRILIVGSGKRVRQAALPALQRLGQRFTVQAVFARTQKSVEVAGTRYDVLPIDRLDASTLASADLVYVAVGKDAVPKVLAHLTANDVSRVDLLIDTPVVRFKHFRHAALLTRFRNAWVAEDCAFLPWFDAAREACAKGPLGPLRRVIFHRSAYAYHGLASAKTLFGCAEIASGRRKRLGDGSARRELTLPGGKEVEIIEPRDYSIGHIVLVGERGSASDCMLGAEALTRGLDAKEQAGAASPDSIANAIPIETLVKDGLCRGFRIGAIETQLNDDEAALTAGDSPTSCLTARMESMKRVGFLRLLRSIDEGHGAYPIASGIDDMVVDYYLEKFGMWRSTALTSPSSSLGRGLLRAASRFGGR